MKISPLDIIKFRERMKLTQGQLADKLGVSERTVQNYEAGKKIPSSKYEIFHRLFREGVSLPKGENNESPSRDELIRMAGIVANYWDVAMLDKKFDAMFHYKAALWAKDLLKD